MSHVLVVEDEASTRRLLETELAASGFLVTLAVDGLDALVKLETVRPDVILCDLAMPNLDGVAFTRAIKANEATRQIPVVFLTANSDPRTMIESINVGARFYVTKPFQMKELLAKLHRAALGESGRPRIQSAP
jgi:CheY-like chemotaxis protein